MKTIEKLNDIIENPSKYGIRKNMLAYSAISRLIRYKSTHTVDVKGGHFARFIHNYTCDVTRVLELANIPYRVGNDAPRGGKCGTYVAIDVKAFKPTEYDAEKYRGYNADGQLIKK